MRQPVRFKVNGQDYELEVEPNRLLIDVLRDDLGLMSVRRSCDGLGFCGACTILLDGKAAHSCSVLAISIKEKEITTVEGLAQNGDLHPLQKSFVEHNAVQCGYCTPGMILAAKALLDENPRPSETEVRAAIAGNLCRCTGYVKIVQAILAVAEQRRNSGN